MFFSEKLRIKFLISDSQATLIIWSKQYEYYFTYITSKLKVINEICSIYSNWSRHLNSSCCDLFAKTLQTWVVYRYPRDIFQLVLYSQYIQCFHQTQQNICQPINIMFKRLSRYLWIGHSIDIQVKCFSMQKICLPEDFQLFFEVLQA